jgi:glycine oxidase
VEEGVVLTGEGAIRAENVVVAAGAWSAELAPDAPPIRPVKGQIVRLREGATPGGAAAPGGAPAPVGATALASRIVRTPRCYVVPRPGGEIVVGATVEERGFDPAVTAGGVHRLLEAAWEVLPDVEERELVETTASFRPGTPDNAPAIGRSAPGGPIWATGHHRNGILLAPITATAVTAMLLGDDPPDAVRHFAPARFARSHA